MGIQNKCKCLQCGFERRREDALIQLSTRKNIIDDLTQGILTTQTNNESMKISDSVRVFEADSDFLFLLNSLLFLFPNGRVGGSQISMLTVSFDAEWRAHFDEMTHNA